MKKGLMLMRKIGKEIMAIKFKPKDSVREIENKFFKIMRKYGIKQGTRLKNGSRLTNNFEWTLCQNLFQSQVRAYFEVWSPLMFKVPKDLEAY